MYLAGFLVAGFLVGGGLRASRGCEGAATATTAPGS